jgi:phospholipase C
MQPMRKVALVGCLCLIGCGGAGDAGPRSSLSPSAAQAARQACMFDKGALPSVSQASDARIGDQIPIDTIVIVMMENRSFDHLLQALPQVGQPDAEVAPAGFSNPDDTDGSQVAIFHETHYCYDDTSHGWTDVHTEWNNGLMDGFVRANYHNDAAPADGKRAMGYYTNDDLPWLYAVANTFAIADHNFASVLGPTFPNREYMYAATSFGSIGNDLFQDERPTIMQELDAAKLDWRVYYTNTSPGLGIFTEVYTHFLANVSLFRQFLVDAQAGKLGQVNFVDPDLESPQQAERNDFHPPGDVQMGQQWLAQVVQAVMQSPQWPHAAIIITFDEHGGIFDHVKPPPACAPDDLAPMLNAGDNAPGDFARYGVRVPLLVVSPYAKPHFVSHNVYDHTSILRFVESRFKLPALTKRDANADPLSDLFDFGKVSFATPPSLPEATIDQTKLDECHQLYPK